MYKSPIKVEYPSWDEMNVTISRTVDDAIVAAVNGCVGISVDETELRRALEYDRDQYAAGYNDGYADGLAAREEQYAAGCAVCPRHKNCMDAFRPNAVNCVAYGVKQDGEEK